MKGFFGIWLAVSFVFFLAVFSRAQEKSGGVDRSLVRDQLEFDLAFSELQVRIAEQDLSADEARDVMGGWFDKNKEIRLDLEERKAELVRDERAAKPKPGLPEMMPVFEGEFPKEFLEAVDGYFRQASDAIWNGVDIGNETEFEAARDRYSAFMEDETSRDLIDQTQDARDTIRDSQIARPPFSAAEIAELVPEEQIEEEIYTRIYQTVLSPEANLNPPKNADEWRDRFAEAQPFIDAKSIELREIHKENRVGRLEARRDSISTQIENVKTE